MRTGGDLSVDSAFPGELASPGYSRAGMTVFPVVLTAAEMRAADAAAVSDLGIPSLLLMENAGRGVADVVRREPGGAGAGARVVIVCGGGANGGDGLVCARHLARAGVKTRVLLVSSRKLEGDAAVMLTALAGLGGVPDRGRQRLAGGGRAGERGSPARR